MIGKITAAFQHLKIAFGKEKPAEALSAIEAIAELFNEELTAAQNGKFFLRPLQNSHTNSHIRPVY